jgi:hypothetical protein
VNILNVIFDSERYMPHGFCYLWQPELVWMHVLSDLVIALAYFSIPVTIFVLLYKRNQAIPFRWVFVMFALFILLCGLSHLLSIIVLWTPYYYLQGVIKSITAMVSLAAAVLLFPLIPQLINIFSDMKDINESRLFNPER